MFPSHFVFRAGTTVMGPLPLLSLRPVLSLRLVLSLRPVLSVGLLLSATLLAAPPVAPLHQPVPDFIRRLVGSDALHAIYPGSGIPNNGAGQNQAPTWREAGMETKSGLAIRNVTLPTVTVYKPAPEKANGTAVIIAPGGGWRQLMMGYEGADLAKWLTARGVTAFVLRYRLARIPDQDEAVAPYFAELSKTMPKADIRNGRTRTIDPAGEAARTWGDEDGRQAIAFVRHHAAHFGVVPNRVGIVGFSAGGGVVMGAVFSPDPDTRPDFAIPVYAAYRMVTPVAANTPPLFIVTGDNDASVPALMASQLYEAWHQAGRPVELHVFQNAPHGFGMTKRNLPVDRWLDLLDGWLDANGLLQRPKEGK